jgi:hypothetical protein
MGSRREWRLNGVLTFQPAESGDAVVARPTERLS